MKGKWLSENLYSIDEKVRVEKSPQILQFACNDANLSDEVTAPHYRIGTRDAKGKIIMPERLPEPARDRAAADPLGTVSEGETMHCVDWDAKHRPWVWHVYKLVQTDELDLDGKPIERFIQQSEFEDKDAAIAAADALAGG